MDENCSSLEGILFVHPFNSDCSLLAYDTMSLMVDADIMEEHSDPFSGLNCIG
jgi:hypothetical protein